MFYKNPYILREKLGNNAFAWEERCKIYNGYPILTIPSLIDWTLDDVKIWEDIVFEEIEDGVLRSCKWLQNFIRLSPSDYPTIWPIAIFDNHNHALYFWLEAVRDGILKPGFELIHIDEHSDLWANNNTLELTRAIKDEKYAYEFTNFSCNVGNYIIPALESGLIGNMIRIENEFELDNHRNYIPSKNSVLNIDLDFFAPELEFIDRQKKISLIQRLLPLVWCITIATSPFFIEPWKAIKALYEIFGE
jgi:hypothetical protein